MIETAEGALRELPGNPPSFAELLAARATTARRLSELRAKIADVDLPDGTTLVLFGSWGRAEVTEDGDVDWALIAHGPRLAVNDPAVVRATTAVRLVLEGEGPAPGRQATFGVAFDGSRLVEHIGLADDDAANFTRRMLLLLESVAVTTPDAHERKMLYFSGLLPILLCHCVSADDMPRLLGEQLEAPATDRVARAFLHLGMPEAGGRTLSAYSAWIGLLSDGRSRARLEELTDATRARDATYARVRRLGNAIDNGVLGLLYESDLGPIARRFLAS